MFTGIIEHQGTIQDIVTKDQAMSLWINSQFDDLVAGESIAIDGVCLTVTEPSGGAFRCDLSPETLAKTTAGTWQQNHSINLERALKFSDRLGGHIVTGHVDTTLQVSTVKSHDEYTEICFTGLTSEQKALVVEKGSIAINGASLTINEVNDDNFNVMLIPHTLAITNLSELNNADKVNIEFDYLARIVAKQLQLKAGA